MDTYSEATARLLLENACPGLLVFRADGVSPIDGTESILRWTPACELDGPNAPDALEAPGLPIPFTANQLAAFFLDGVGLFACDAYGEWKDGPDEDVLASLGIRANKAREVIRSAYACIRSAMDLAGPRDIELAENVQKLASEHRQRNMAANNSEDIWGRRDAAEAKRKGQEFEEISHEEYRLRRQRAVASLGDLPKRLAEAQHLSHLADAKWRKEMVNLLIAPGAESRLASESPKEKIHSSVFEPLFPILDKYWGYEYSDLPVTLRFRIAEYFSLIGWDACNISNRQARVKEMDFDRDPGTNKERQHAFDLVDKLGEIEREIRELKLSGTPTTLDVLAKKKPLLEMRNALNNTTVALANVGQKSHLAVGVKPVQRSAAQDEEILSAIAKQGFSPMAMPKVIAGIPGVKAGVREALGTKGLWSGARVFDKAWERLLARKQIGYLK